MSVFPDDVDVGIVAHDAVTTIDRTLAALSAASCPDSQILVVDVGSTDGLVDWLTSRHPSIRRYRIGQNVGPGPGRNLAIREAVRPYLFLMDADVEVEPDAIRLLRQAMADDPRVGIGSPVVVHVDRPDVIQYAGTWLHFICEASNPFLDRPFRERGDAPADIGVASTCGLLLHRARAIDIGPFDERYFIGKEDGDFTHRMVLAGYRVWEVPQARVRHRSRRRGDWLFYFQIRNRWHFLLKSYEWRTMAVIFPVLAVHEALQFVTLVAKGYLLVYLKAVLGLLRMLPTLPRDRAAVVRIRAVHDRVLLRGGSMVVRSDLVGGVGARLSMLYFSALDLYWRAARRLLPL